MTGQWLGGLAADHLGWRWAFIALSVAFPVASLLLWQRTRRLVKVPGGDEPHKPSPINHMTRSAKLVLIASVRWVLSVAALFMDGAAVWTVFSAAAVGIAALGVVVSRRVG